jgi:hypothetical protein
MTEAALIANPYHPANCQCGPHGKRSSGSDFMPPQTVDEKIKLGISIQFFQVPAT